jgi:hypothetical protein
MREIGQVMGVWFSVVWGSPPLGFPGGYIIEFLAQACQANNGSVKLSSPLGKFFPVIEVLRSQTPVARWEYLVSL